ncbi:hypothetical protein FD754_010459 [Muntiacus muntjak]|uniref:Uncharacterized protein n=1 Tax=Muntiacus muntjak TaxID=9888 RepID=A0A5N3WY44_MUNMU|nr:hypothetical protein FD754_010459 [Muntiacus muntjak]
MGKKKWFLSRKKGLKCKATPEETQEAAAAEDGMMESRVQPLKPAAFPPGFIKKNSEREALSDKVVYDEATDEFASYFNRLLPRFSSPHQVIPNSHASYRRALALKKLFHSAISRDFTDLILPNGSVAQFKQERRGKEPTVHTPEIILNNFKNTTGYIFKSEKKVGIQELAPRFTLKLGSLQKGTFDSKYGEYEWVHKPWETNRSRRKFHLQRTEWVLMDCDEQAYLEFMKQDPFQKGNY